MDIVIEFIVQRWHEILSVVTGFGIGDALDILIFTFLFYECINLVRETRGGQLVKGIVFIVVAYIVSGWLQMNMINWIIEQILGVGFIALVILFQPELRRILEQIGRTSRFNVFGRVISEEEVVKIQRDAISEVTKACISMQNSKTGALIVFEKQTMLGEVIDTGRSIDAIVSVELLCNIFFPKAPLHDGAVILRFGKIQAASCILPLTQNNDLNNELGTRHRAALGMSEVSDAVIVVVSEETGIISLAFNGKLQRGLDSITLKSELENMLILKNDDENNVSIIKKITRWFK